MVMNLPQYPWLKDEQLIITTANGMAIRFDSKEVSPTSRATSGVKGINLAGDWLFIASCKKC